MLYNLFGGYMEQLLETVWFWWTFWWKNGVNPKKVITVDFVVKNHETTLSNIWKMLEEAPSDPCNPQEVDRRLIEDELRKTKEGEEVKIYFFPIFIGKRAIVQPHQWMLYTCNLMEDYSALGIKPLNGALLLAFNAENPKFSATVPNVSIKGDYRAHVNTKGVVGMKKVSQETGWENTWYLAGTR